jgi:transposase InsO family protein
MTQPQGGLNVEQICQLAGVSRAGYYRSLREKEPRKEEMMVRAAIQEIVIEHKRRYGSPRVTRELRHRGLAVNHKRVERLMREDNLLALRQHKFRATTDSRHDFPVYLNLAARMNLTGINQLWVADITYVRLREEFVYLAIVLDRFSRRVLGWALERYITAQLTAAALQAAIALRHPPVGLVHHSDRGVQYASEEYIALLTAHGMLPSMSRPANPYDNAFCESFMKTLKTEEIYCHQYRDLEDLRHNMEAFIEDYYNRARLHSALGYRTPIEFETAQTVTQPTELTAAAKVSFPRHEEIYRSDIVPFGEQDSACSPAHRLDESPDDYSLASCSPAELTSASPSDQNLATNTDHASR